MKKTLPIVIAVLLTAIAAVVVVCVLLFARGHGKKTEEAPEMQTATEWAAAETDAAADLTMTFPETQTKKQTANETAPKSSEPIDQKTAEKYTAYLREVGYLQFMYDYDDPGKQISVESCMTDINGDGVQEMLIRMSDAGNGGIRGSYSETALLTIRGGKVETIGRATFGGGSAGGDYLEFNYDTKEKKHVLVYEEYVREGTFGSTWTKHFFDVKRKESNPVTYGLMAGFVQFKETHSLMQAFFSEKMYADNIKLICGETDLYRRDEEVDGIWVNLYDDKYLSEKDWNAIRDRYTDPVDPVYTLQSVSLEDPIPHR